MEHEGSLPCLAQPAKKVTCWTTTLFRLSTTIYTMYLQLHSTPGGYLFNLQLDVGLHRGDRFPLDPEENRKM
jgi:hypothetical protein